jgi:hypothetical protein
MPDIFQEINSVGVLKVAELNGLEVKDRTFGPCPACGAKTRHTKRHDSRLACLAVQSGYGWVCIQCDSKGDTVDLYARLSNGGERPKGSVAWRAVLSRWKGGGAITPLPRSPEAQERAARGLPVALPRPPHTEVFALWGRSYGLPPPQALDWLAKKFPKYTKDQIIEAGVVRFLPRDDLPEWFPWRHGYMAMLAFDHHGLVQSIHGRMTGEPEQGKPKSRFPKGYSASGLVLANKTGTSWLRGKMQVESVVIAEGLTSTLATTMAMRAIGRWDTAVFGYTSGSNSCIKQMPWTNQSVIVMTDNDKAGDLYAEKVLSVLPTNIDVRRAVYE